MTQFNTPTYEVKRPTGRCALTDQELVPGEPYMATLVKIDEDEAADQAKSAKPTAATALGLKRVDISWDVWQQNERPERLFCFWKTTVPEANKKRTLFVDNAVLMNLFRRLADEDDEQRLAFRFVLGLILMRKKYLRYDGTQCRDGKDEQGNTVQENWWQVMPKLDLTKGPLGKWNEDDKLEMLDPHLDESRIQQVTEQLNQILEAEL